MDDFYVTLPSNDVSFPNNTISDFRITLPHTLSLKGRYECALCEISFPKSWSNIIATDENYNTFGINWKGLRNEQLVCKISAGIYETPQSIITEIENAISVSYLEKLKEIQKRFELDDSVMERIKNEGIATREITEIFNRNLYGKVLSLDFNEYTHSFNNAYFKSLNEMRQGVFFNYNSLNKKVTLKLNKNLFDGISLSPVLQYILGFEHGKMTQDKTVGKYSVDMTAGITTLFLYTDIIESQIIGSGYAKLLRTVPVQTTGYGERIHMTFSKPHYVDLAYNTFSSIEINIKDHGGHKIFFNHGIVIVKIHFRRKKLNIF